MHPPQVEFIGDVYRGGAYLGAGRELLRSLQHRMRFNGLQQGEDIRAYPDGVTIRVRVMFGLSSITIECPVEAPAFEKMEWEVHEPDPATGHFFVKYIVESPPVEHDPDLPPPPPKEPKTECAWVVFDKEHPDGFFVAKEGETIKGKTYVQIPKDAQKNVGAKLPFPYPELTGTLTTQNFGGKAFNLSKAGTKRFCAYTGNTPLLFRGGKLMYKGSPCLETYQDELFPTIYMANMHKMIVQNDKHVAWYYYKQEPYFVMGMMGEMDLRFTVCTLDLVSIVGDEHEVCVKTPRAKMRGSQGGISDSAATSLIHDSSGLSSLNGWKSDWLSPWAGWYQILQFPQGMHVLLDVKEIDPRSFENEAWVTLFMCSEDALVERKYTLDPELKGDMGFGFGYNYGGYQPFIENTVVENGFSWCWSKEGFKQWDSLEYAFEMEGYLKWPRWCQEVHRADGNQYRRTGLFGFTQCHWMNHSRYGGTRFGAGGPNGGCAIFMPYSGSSAYGLGFRESGNGNGRMFKVFKKYRGLFGPFAAESLQRFYRHGAFSVGVHQNGHGWIWGEPRLGWNEGGGYYAICAWTYYADESPFTFRWQFNSANLTNMNDTNDFDFLWHDMYNDPWATGVEMVCPNIFIEKGRKKRSHCAASSLYREQKDGAWQDLESSDMWWGFAAPHVEWWPSMQYIDDWLSPYPDIPFSCPDDLMLSWEPVTGYMSGGGMRKSGSWSNDCGSEELKVHCTDGNAHFTLPKNAWEYYYMDDRSVNEDAQGVFLACKTGVNWRFFHFWENSGTMKEITEKLINKLGLVTPRQRVGLQCIGII